MDPEVDDKNGLSEAKGSIAAEVTVESFDRLKEQFLTDTEATSKFERPDYWLGSNMSHCQIRSTQKAWVKKVGKSKVVAKNGCNDVNPNKF